MKTTAEVADLMDGLKQAVLHQQLPPQLVASDLPASRRMGPEEGLVLTDSSFGSVAFDRGSAAIFRHRTHQIKPGSASHFPAQVQELAQHRPAGPPYVKTQFRIGKKDYVCQAHVLEACEPGVFLTDPVIALHIEEVSPANDPVTAIAAKYGLTEREQEALRGISLGLTNHELADRMNISSNTVRAYVRLIMSRMGVSTRGAIIAKVLKRANAAPHARR